MVRILFFLLSAYWMYLVPSAPITALVWYCTKARLKWIYWDYLILLLPFMVWALCFFLWSSGKSLSNLGVEPFLLGCCAAISPLVKRGLNGKIDERQRAIIMVVSVSMIGIGLWRWIPGLPE